MFGGSQHTPALLHVGQTSEWLMALVPPRDVFRVVFVAEQQTGRRDRPVSAAAVRSTKVGGFHSHEVARGSHPFALST